MPTYYYTASDKLGEIKTGEIDAPSKIDVINFLQRNNFFIISITAKKTGGILNYFQRITLFEKVSDEDKILLTKHLATMLHAGLSLIESIEILLDQSKKPLLRKILSDAKFNLEKGLPISATFEKYPDQFSNVFINLIKTGEISGNLEKNLKYLGEQLSKDYELKRKIKSAMIYPALLVSASIGVIILILTLVVPRLSKAFTESGIKLPFFTKLIVNISDIITYNIYLTIFTMVGLIFFFFYFKKTPVGKNFFNELFSKIPLIKKIITEITLARFFRNLATIHSSGISIIEALKITSDAMEIKPYKDALTEFAKEIAKGVSLGNLIIKKPKLFPRMAASMVSVGEKTGSLDEIFNNLALFYEEAVDNTLKTLVSLIEPMLLVILGIVIGGIALSIIVPIYQLVGAIK